MELWIRSQDKTQLGIIVGVILVDNELRGFTNYNQNYFELGTYKTKERALEVLDEIQKLFMPTYLISNISKEDGLKLQDNIAFATNIIQTKDNSKIEQINGSIIYQMPKE